MDVEAASASSSDNIRFDDHEETEKEICMNCSGIKVETNLMSNIERSTCADKLEPEHQRKRLTAVSDVVTSLSDVVTSFSDDYVNNPLKTNVSGSTLRQRSISLDTMHLNEQDQTDNIQQPTKGCNIQLSNISKVQDKPEVTFEDVVSSTLNEKRLYETKLSNGRILKRTKSQIERMKVLRIPRDSSFRRLVYKINGNAKHDVDRVDDDDDRQSPVKRPKSFFDLAIVTMCFCASPLGLAAVIMAVLSSSNYKAGHVDKAVRYSRLAMVFSILGILTTVATAITLLMVLKYPWTDVRRP